MKRIITIVAVAAIALGVAACGSQTPNAINHAEHTIDSQLATLERAEPIPRMLDSADRKIQAYMYTAEADPNKVWYLETLSMTGSVEATYTIRGPVVPAGDEVSNPQQVVCRTNGHEDCVPIALAEPNGIYQHDTNDHLALLTSGALLRFEGQYQVSDQPFVVKTPTSIAIDGSKPISSTDLSKTEGGKLAPRG